MCGTTIRFFSISSFAVHTGCPYYENNLFSCRGFRRLFFLNTNVDYRDSCERGSPNEKGSVPRSHYSRKKKFSLFCYHYYHHSQRDRPSVSVMFRKPSARPIPQMPIAGSRGRFCSFSSQNVLQIEKCLYFCLR